MSFLKSIFESVYEVGNRNLDLKSRIEESVELLKDKHSGESLLEIKTYIDVIGWFASVGSVLSGVSYVNEVFTNGNPEPFQTMTIVSLSFLGAFEFLKKKGLMGAFLSKMRTKKARPVFYSFLFIGLLGLGISWGTSISGTMGWFVGKTDNIRLSENQISDVVNVDSINKIHDEKIKNLEAEKDELNETAKKLSTNWNPQANEYTDMVKNTRDEIAKEEIRRNAAIREAKRKNDAFRATKTNILVKTQEKQGHNMLSLTVFCEIFSIIQIFFHGFYHYSSAKDQVAVQPDLLEAAKQVIYIDVANNPHTRSFIELQNQVKQIEARQRQAEDVTDYDSEKKTT